MPLNARRHIRRMRGGAQAHLIQADDEQYYVVKFRNNPQHRRILINEVIAAVFLRYLQIAAPEAAFITLSKEFLAENPELAIQIGPRRIEVEPGWHFGSRFPGDPDHLAIYDFLPDILLREVVNLRDFLGILVFDKWTGNSDSRQSIFFRSRISEWIAARTSTRPGFANWMIDHGFAFNGPWWDFPDAPLQGIYHRPIVYESVRGFDDFEPWLERIVHFPDSVLDQALRQVPLQWLENEEDSLDALFEKLAARRQRVPDLLCECRRARPALFPNWAG